MAKEFDIYLRRHLVESDLLIYSIPYHDGISVTNRLIVNAIMNGVLFQHKFARVNSGLEVDARVNDTIKWCFEQLRIGVELDTTADFKAMGRIVTENDPIIIDVSKIDLLGQSFNEVDSGLILAVRPLDTHLAVSLGRSEFPLIVDVRVDETLKRDFLTTSSIIIPDAAVEQINQVDYIKADTSVIVASALQSLCYKLTFDAKSAIEMMTLVLGTEIRHSLGVWYQGIAVDAEVNGEWAQKFITTETEMTITQDVVEIPVKVLYPDDTPIVIRVDDIHGSLKRYRLLNEVDDFALEEIDDMTLDELDYVWLTD